MRKLNSALQKIQAVFDNEGETIDRYFILLKEGVTDDPGAFFTVSDNPDSPQGGVSQYGTGAGSYMKAPGKNIDVLELPTKVIEHLNKRLG